jgi:PHD/YefM family antitoxin component YafN of YafNO toxin-antitoxin module
VHGQASAVIMSPDDLEQLEETIAVLAGETLIRDLTASEVDLAAGHVEDADSLAAAMRARKKGA